MRRAVLSILSVFAPLMAFATEGGKPFFRNVTAVEYHGHNRNFDIHCDNKGRVYVANFEGLISWDGMEWSAAHTPGISRITCLYRDTKDRLWIGGYNVLGYMDDEGEVCYVCCDTASTGFGEVYNVYGEGGYVCFDTQDCKYKVVDDKYIVVVSSLDQTGTSSISRRWHNLETSQILDIPDQQLRAIATKSDGLFFVDKDDKVKFSLSEKDGLCSNNIEAISYDGKGSLWGATSNGIFQVCISPVFSHYGVTDGLAGQVTSITHSKGRLFVGTLQGLFELGSDNSFRQTEGINLACWQVCDYRGGVLAATAQGLFLYDGKLKQLTERHTLVIHITKDSGIITGEVDGIYRINSDGTSQRLSDAPNVASFKRTATGLWAINYYGDTYYLDDNKTEFTKRKSDDMALTFQYIDDAGHIWRSGFDNKGLSCDALFPSQIKWCKALDGHNIEAAEVVGDEMFVGGNFGLICMNLAKMKAIEPYKPALQIRDLEITKYSAGYDVYMDKTDPIGTVEYGYSTSSDGNWSEWSNTGSVNFGRMDIGKYNLSIRCRDAFGNISVVGPIPFTIQPPIYFKWYAFLLYLAILVGLAFIYFRIKMQNARKEQERLEGLVDQRTRELKDAQGQLLRQEREATVGKLTKGLIDRILNPMNYINNFSHLSIGLANDLAEDVEDEKDNMTPDNYDDCVDICDMLKTNLGKIEAHGLATTRILKAMEELLKERSGKTETADMVAICNQNSEMVRNYFKNEIAEIGIDFQWQAPASPVVAVVNQENISKTIMSMLNNSVYAVRKKFQKGEDHGDQKPLIRLSLEPGAGGKGCRIEIYDNGVGMEESILDKIFDPFFTTKPTGEAPGVGLYLSQQVVQDLGGRIKVDSKKDEYARFTIELA